jgi:lipoate-protein ligase A
MWRVMDTGILSAAENIAYNQALLACQAQPEATPILRFLRFTPSALIGFHQAVEQELHLEFCQQNQIAIQRRITGGGAIYFDERQLGWELYFKKSHVGIADMTELAAKICTAAAASLTPFLAPVGLEAKFRPRNDIEVNGRKISGTGGVFDGDCVLYQGTLLIDFDIERMLKVLRIPAEKLSDKAIASAAERVTSLKSLLPKVPDLEQIYAAMQQSFAEAFAADFASGTLTAAEQVAYRESLQEIQSDDWVFQKQAPPEAAPLLTAMQKTPGGLLKVALSYDKASDLIKQVWLYGDFFLEPRRAVVDLEAALKNTPVAVMPVVIREFFRKNALWALQLSAEDFIQVIELAVKSHDGN